MSLKPGWELDALIAEKVFGWRRAVGLPVILYPPDENTDDFPRYSRDLDAAWLVVDKLLQMFLVEKRIANSVSPTRPEPSTAFSVSYEMASEREFSKEVLTGPYVSLMVHRIGLLKVIEKGESVPHAICLAALAAVGYESPK